jgi:hypothetical protein
MLSSTSLAQTAPAQPTAPDQQAVPSQEATATQQTAPAQQTAAAQETAPTQQAVPTQQPEAGAASSKPEAAGPEAEGQPSTSSPSPTASTPSPEEADANAGGVPAAPLFAPGAKIFLEPMNEFEQFLPHAILTHKVPVVVVKERAQADFVMSGSVRVKKPGWITGMVLSTGGGVNVSLKDARTGNMVFACVLHRVDQGLAEGYQYQKWADQCASRLNHVMKKK